MNVQKRFVFRRGATFVTFIGGVLLGLAGQPALAETSVIPTQVQVQSSAQKIAADQTLTLTAEVRPIVQGSGIPTGTVEFYDGPTALGSAGLSMVNGVATASTGVKLVVGLHPIIVKYTGDLSYAPSRSVPPLAQFVTAQ